MRISELYIYPIKSLRPCLVQHARLRPEGVEHDRRFMLLKVIPPNDGGQTTYKPVQVVKMPEAALFSQRLLCDDEVDGDEDDEMLERQLNGSKDDNSNTSDRKEPTTIEVTYHIPQTPIAPSHGLQRQKLHIPLHPDPKFLETTETVEIALMDSPSPAHRMGGPYDAWFTACLGYEAHLVYTGGFKRTVLAHLPSFSSSSTSPNTTSIRSNTTSSWLSSTLSSILPSSLTGATPTSASPPGIVYNECAPYLITSRASLQDFSKNFKDGMDMTKFRPNVVVDDLPQQQQTQNSSSSSSCPPTSPTLQPWEEDYWAELSISSPASNMEEQSSCRLELTANCGRCNSINVDYDTGRTAEGEQGTVLKKLMKDRRVDVGAKYTPVFGRYAFLVPRSGKEVGCGSDSSQQPQGGGEYADIHVGDVVTVTRRNDQRDVWSWPKYK